MPNVARYSVLIRYITLHSTDGEKFSSVEGSLEPATLRQRLTCMLSNRKPGNQPFVLIGPHIYKCIYRRAGPAGKLSNH